MTLKLLEYCSWKFLNTYHSCSERMKHILFLRKHMHILTYFIFCLNIWNSYDTCCRIRSMYYFDSKRKWANYWNFHTIKSTALITTKFCVMITTTKYCPWVVQISPKQIQDGGRPPSWEIEQEGLAVDSIARDVIYTSRAKNCNISAMDRLILTRQAYINAVWPVTGL